MRASRIVAVSGVTKTDLETIFHVSGQNIDVVHEGVDREAFSFGTNEKDGDTFRKEYNLPERYLLCVGTGGYKNVEGSIRAFKAVKQQIDWPLKLVIAGNKRTLGEDKYQLVHELELDEEVIFTDFFPDQDLKYLYRYSELLLFPSHYEGFGLPVLEAFACGTPVVTSTAGSLPEVAGNCTLEVDPTSTEDIASAVLKFLTDEELRKSKCQQGLERAKEFSWEEAARKTLDVFKRVAERQQRLSVVNHRE